MNRLVTIGLAIAVAPAILIGIANVAAVSDLVEVATLALMVAVPVGALLVATGLLLETGKGFLVVSAQPERPRSRYRRSREDGPEFQRQPDLSSAL